MKNNSKNITVIIGIIILAVGVWYVLGRLPHKEIRNSENPQANNPSSPSDVQDLNWKKYTSDNYKFSIEYPSDFSVNENHTYSALGPGKEIKGIAFPVSEAISKGTNLSSDSYFSVEQLSTTDCTGSNFMSNPQTDNTVTENNKTYNVATGGDAGAGNRYEDTVFATKFNNVCYGIRLMIHSTVIENYEPGTVPEYNRSQLIELYNRFRLSFTPFSETPKGE